MLFPDGSAVAGEVVWRDAERDLAVVIVSAAAVLEPAPRADPVGLRPGTVVFALGHPWGVRDAISVGVFHAVGPVPDGYRLPPPMRRLAWVQAAVRLAPGNSGGPIADAEGQVIGVSTVIAGGLALAVPIPEIEARW